MRPAPKNESEFRVDLVNGSMIRLYGADNPHALRGPYLDGVVLDEFADMKPEVWHEVVRPMLVDRRGWATFIGTPKGKNDCRVGQHGGVRPGQCLLPALSGHPDTLNTL